MEAAQIRQWNAKLSGGTDEAGSAGDIAGRVFADLFTGGAYELIRELMPPKAKATYVQYLNSPAAVAPASTPTSDDDPDDDSDDDDADDSSSMSGVIVLHGRPRHVKPHPAHVAHIKKALARAAPGVERAYASGWKSARFSPAQVKAMKFGSHQQKRAFIRAWKYSTGRKKIRPPKSSGIVHVSGFAGFADPGGAMTQQRNDALDAVQAAVGTAIDNTHGVVGIAEASTSESWLSPTSWFGAKNTAIGGSTDKVVALQSVQREWIRESAGDPPFGGDVAQFQAWLDQGNQLIAQAKALAQEISAELAARDIFSKFLVWNAENMIDPNDRSLNDPSNKPPSWMSTKGLVIAGGVVAGIVVLRALSRLRNPRARRAGFYAGRGARYGVRGARAAARGTKDFFGGVREGWRKVNPSKLPWWAKALGVVVVGGVAYKVLKPKGAGVPRNLTPDQKQLEEKGAAEKQEVFTTDSTGAREAVPEYLLNASVSPDVTGGP